MDTHTRSNLRKAFYINSLHAVKSIAITIFVVFFAVGEVSAQEGLSSTAATVAVPREVERQIINVIEGDAADLSESPLTIPNVSKDDGADLVSAEYMRPVDLADVSFPERVAGVLRSSAFERTDVLSSFDPELDRVYQELAVEHRLEPSGDAFHRAGNDNVYVIPLRQTAAQRQTDSTFLFFDRATKETYFLLLSHDPTTGGAVRFWSSGATEIVIDNRGIYYLPTPSEATFRLRPASQRGSQDPRSAVAVNGVSDNLLCLARLLGISVNAANLEKTISSIICNTFKTSEIARNLAELVFIGGHCLSAVNCLGLCPASSALCVVGLTKWISCGIADCSNASPIPAIPSLSSPANGATVAGSEITLSWTSVAGATKYQSQLSRDSSFGSVITGNEQSSNSTRWTGFPSDGSRWYWRVRAGNSQGWSSWSGSRHFFNGGGSASVPAVPALSSPANGASVPGASVTLVVKAVAGATKYQTQLSRDSSFSNPITGGEFASTSVTWSGFGNDGSKWYWRARAGNTRGWSGWSSSRNFVNRP